MKEDLQTWENTPFPDMVRSLPELDVKEKGVRGWLLQGPNQQVVFFLIDPIGEIPEHSHGEQWGVALQGRMELTVQGQTRTVGRGDCFHIPADAPHSAKFLERFASISFFADKDRYKPKKI